MAGMLPATGQPPKTVRDLLALGEDVRAELVAGEILVTPAPGLPHQRAVLSLALSLTAWADRESAGEVLVAPVDLYLPSGDVVQPDLVFVSGARRAILTDQVRGVPDLVVEVLSPSSSARDRDVKRELYARNGVPEYWIVDPLAHTIEVLRHAQGRYGRDGLYGGADRLISASLPGLSLSASAVFARRQA
jgi:Uma2 family endonuclease